MRDPRRALAAVARSGGGVVELRPGTWLVTDPATTERLLASRHAMTARTARGAAASWGEGGLERWMAARRAARPDLQRRIRDEATAHPDPRAADLPLCRAVVRETLRLHPPIWQLRRVLDAPVPGFPAGAEVLFSPYVNHRDPAAHPDPDRFDPHRWATATRPSPGSYLPFALGPRFCPGSHLATAELAVVLAAVLERHHVAPHRAPKPSRGVLNAPRRLRLTLVPHDRR